MAPSYYRVFALNRMYWLGGGLCRVAESTTTAAAAAAAACAVEPKLSREQSTGRERETPLGSALRALASLLCAYRNTGNTRAAGRSKNPVGCGRVLSNAA